MSDKKARAQKKRAVRAITKKKYAKPVSLHPLSFEDALAALVGSKLAAKRRP